MIGLLWSILTILVSPCRSNARLEAENAVLRHQLLVLRRKCRGRVRLTNFDRWIFVQLYRLFPSVLQVLHVIRPETLVRWHRAGFRSYWRWKPEQGRASNVRIFDPDVGQNGNARLNASAARKRHRRPVCVPKTTFGRIGDEVRREPERM